MLLSFVFAYHPLTFFQTARPHVRLMVEFVWGARFRAGKITRYTLELSHVVGLTAHCAQPLLLCLTNYRCFLEINKLGVLVLPICLRARSCVTDADTVRALARVEVLGNIF